MTSLISKSFVMVISLSDENQLILIVDIFIRTEYTPNFASNYAIASEIRKNAYNLGCHNLMRFCYLLSNGIRARNKHKHVFGYTTMKSLFNQISATWIRGHILLRTAPASYARCKVQRLKLENNER